MRLPVDDEFWQQLERFAFRFTCEDCVHHDPAAERCVHEWPAAEHRRQRCASPPATQIVFCKEFELR